MERGLNGTVTTRHLLTNAGDIIRGFGWGCYLRCWEAVLLGKRTTFLAMAW